MAEAGVGENEPLINSLVGSLGASGYLDISLSPSNQHIETPEDGRVPMFGLIGPNLKLKRVLKLYYFILIYVLYRFYYNNAGKLATSMLSLAFFPNSSSNGSSNSGDPFSLDHPYFKFLFQMFEYIIPSFLSIIFAFVSDYGKYQRAYLLNYSLGISSFAAFVITICGYVLSVRRFVSTPLPLVLDVVGLPLHKILSVLGLISFEIGLALFIPISLAYGLDLLEGTKWKVAYFYFPLMYVANNVGNAFSYLDYLDATPSHLNINSLICLVVVIIAWVLFIIGRGCRILPDHRSDKDDFTIHEGIKMFYYALKKRMTDKSPRGHWFIQLASVEHFGKYSHEKVQRISAFFRIHFCLILLLLIFTAFQVLETVFPQQGYMLSIPSPVNQTVMYCGSQNTPYIDNLHFINSFGILLCTPLFELLFWNIAFCSKDDTQPKFFKYIKNGLIKNGLQKIIKLIRDYFHSFDPILKKIFWGLFFGLASIICALLVEVIRIVTIPVNQQQINCNPFGFRHKYRISGISIFSQVPQYMLGSLLEVLTLIGIQQFIYFQWFHTFKSSYKSSFLGLFYLYYALGSMLANVTYSLIDSSCQKKYNCQLCFVYNDACSDNDFELTTVIWAVLIMVYLVIIVFFGMFSHYRHFQNKRMHLRGDDFHNQFIDCSQTEG